MNIVAKEYVSSRVDNDGALLLSQFTGAARELSEAIFINPFDIEEFADKIKQAIEMKPEERTRRMKALRSVVEDKNIYKWAGNIISEFSRVQNHINDKVKAPTH
jgi:trehalose 6-phosphate synthase